MKLKITHRPEIVKEIEIKELPIFLKHKNQDIEYCWFIFEKNDYTYCVPINTVNDIVEGINDVGSRNLPEQLLFNKSRIYYGKEAIEMYLQRCDLIKNQFLMKLDIAKTIHVPDID